MAKPEEHYAIAMNIANQVGAQLQAAAMAEGGGAPTGEVLALARLQVELGRLAVEIERPGRGLIIPGHGVSWRHPEQAGRMAS